LLRLREARMSPALAALLVTGAMLAAAPAAGAGLPEGAAIDEYVENPPGNLILPDESDQEVAPGTVPSEPGTPIAPGAPTDATGPGSQEGDAGNRGAPGQAGPGVSAFERGGGEVPGTSFPMTPFALVFGALLAMGLAVRLGLAIAARART
jgi:hypothetical protein